MSCYAKVFTQSIYPKIMNQKFIDKYLGPDRLLYCLLLAATLFTCTNSDTLHSDNWQSIHTVDDLWKNHPGQIRSLLEAIDLQQPALGPVRLVLAQGDTIGAAEELLKHYRKTDRQWVVTTLDAVPYEEALRLANALLADTVIRGGNPAKIMYEPDGGWQWNYTGPDKDDEFAYSLNGQRYLSSLLMAWEKTGTTAYISLYDRLLKDWVLHHPLPAPDDSIYLVLNNQGLDYRDLGEVEWRTIEAGQRLGAVWPQTFYGFQQEEAFSPATRLLMLSSMAVQADFLTNYHKDGHNWTTMEMNGLALVGLSFPEFKAADRWANYALEVMTKEINRQVYPDGIQSEISSKTQWVALRRFESVANNFQKANRELSAAYLKRVEEMYQYLAYSIRPDGHQPLNNDSDRDKLKDIVINAAERFDRSDWNYIATNGKSGSKPAMDPTVTFPWAGIHIMRNGWHEKAHWSFFDAGPYGTGHQHRDKLHLSIAAFGKDLLVDGGRFTHKDYFSFDPTMWRGYFRSSFSHNVILVDGKGQNEGPTRADTPLVENQDYSRHALYDYAHGTFDDGYEGVEGKATHTRSVLYLRNKYWVVLDQFETDRPRALQVLWHYAPDHEVVLEGTEAVSNNPQAANIRIVPVGKVNWDAEIIKGQEKPVIQGWYSSVFGVKVPNPTIVYSAGIAESSTFVWLLLPADGEVPTIDAQMAQKGDLINLTVKEKNGSTVNITLPLDNNPLDVKVEF